jgi:AAA+ superfamily predicted ATPase
LEKPFDQGVTWESCEDVRASQALERLAAKAPHLFGNAVAEGARCAALPFYADHELIELRFEHAFGTECVFALDGPDDTRWLDGSSAPIHETNEAGSLALSDANVHDYVRFFLYFVRGESGAFVLVESENEITVDDEVGAEGDGSEPRARLAKLASRVTPLTIREIDDTGRWVLDCTIAFDGALFLATLAVTRDGNVDMTDDEPIEALESLSVPELASLELGAVEPEWLQLPSGTTPGVPPIVTRGTAATGDEVSIASVPQFVEKPLDDLGEVPRDRDVTEAVVSVLLDGAIRARDETTDSSVLLQHFNAETGSNKPIDRLTRLVSRSMPVIIIESDIPFVEDFVAALVAPGATVSRASASASDESCGEVSVAGSVDVYLISFHAYRRLWDVERLAHELAIQDASVFVGCERLSDVPEPLQHIADLVLEFPRIDRKLFAQIFERVFHAKPAAGWDTAGADWTRYLVPADFHTPRRLRLGPDDALLFLRKRVEERLAAVTPDFGKRLSELHGLGEARQVCEDLITDIHAAQAGKIPWSAVDRGLLLAGAPGTGKTTLARAVARECGVKFIVGSAAGWQSAGHLDAHLRAMRSDFSEARRFAPAILFIDEIDGIGSRELLGGDHSATYQTDVINALLEQIQGIDTVDPVILIGATNYPEKVDPALRRAGRLDQTVEIPLPNVASLEAIFTDYLKPYREQKEVARGVKARPLAELCLGATGADVEFFVRGAARRARRARRKMTQEDLLAEITRRPRRPDSAPRLRPEDMRRVAVHEAGHALARLTSSTKGEDLTFVTIVPRTNGSLGFVAAVPSESEISTRRTMLEELETVLAGRAAEEMVYGSDDIGGGAGGPSRSSDLAVATRWAELIVCQSGLGDDDALHWTERPTEVQEKQIGELLAKAYDNIVQRLEEHRALLDEIVAILLDRQELSGADLRGLLHAERVPAPARSAS